MGPGTRSHLLPTDSATGAPAPPAAPLPRSVGHAVRVIYDDGAQAARWFLFGSRASTADEVELGYNATRDDDDPYLTVRYRGRFGRRHQVTLRLGEADELLRLHDAASRMLRYRRVAARAGTDQP